MTRLANLSFRARRLVRARWAVLVALGWWPLISMAGQAELRDALLVWTGATAALGVALVRVMGRVLKETRAPGRDDELEAGVVALTSIYALLTLSGAHAAALHPLVYLLASVLVILVHSRAVRAAFVVSAVCLEAMWLSGPGLARTWPTVLTHALWIGAFAGMASLTMSGIANRLRRRHGQALAEELERNRTEAREFRLISSSLPADSRTRTREEEQAKLTQGAVEALHDQLYHHVDLLREGLSLQTCALLWCDPDAPVDSRGTPVLKIKEVSSTSERIRSEAKLEQVGVLAAAVRARKPLRLHNLGPSRMPPYYDGVEQVGALCVVPLMEGERLVGVLCADRAAADEFTQEQEDVLARAAEQVLRVIAFERAFVATERAKYEQEQFCQASELLNQALTMDDVVDKALRSLNSITSFDLAAITTVDHATNEHHVIAARVQEANGPWAEVAEALRELRFPGTNGLVALAVKNRHYMPASGEWNDPNALVFTPRTKLKHAKSLLVLPLVRGEQVLGTIVLAAERARAWSAHQREMAQVIANQVTTSLENARMYNAMEERATTDGLTGLTNHRSFQDRLAQLHALSERTRGRYSLILTDIDHFKSINDTYGHPVGDEVLRQVAGIFKARARKVDIVARYGGEEFVLVLPDTDAEAAEKVANELREEVAARTMHSDNGTFRVTISMGIAQFPDDGAQRAELIERADQALYHCKHNGRNCVTVWRSTKARASA